MNNTEILLQVEQLWKSFHSGTRIIEVLRGINFECAAGELLAVMGPSGCGKTTLLNLISGLDRVDQGSLKYKGKELAGQRDEDWDEFRRHELGMIFQFNQLLPEFSALENTLLPALIASRSKLKSLDSVQAKAEELLIKLGLQDRLNHRPSQLSGGEQQRVAIARSLMNSPKLILADEPTGSLDLESGFRVFEMLKTLQKEKGFSCLIVTHNRDLADMCDRIITLYHKTG